MGQNRQQAYVVVFSLENAHARAYESAGTQTTPVTRHMLKALTLGPRGPLGGPPSLHRLLTETPVTFVAGVFSSNLASTPSREVVLPAVDIPELALSSPPATAATGYVCSLGQS
jgi:hypothetical protein